MVRGMIKTFWIYCISFCNGLCFSIKTLPLNDGSTFGQLYSNEMGNGIFKVNPYMIL